MIKIAAWSAAFDRPLEGLSAENLRVVGPQKTTKTTSPAAMYALAAARCLEIPQTSGLFTLMGASGCTCNAFDGAWRRSSDGQLTGTDFGTSRYKRIHPLTLITSLQNQLPAVLSMELGLHGPCLNALESPDALIHAMVNIQAMLASQGSVLIVLAAAPDRDEERVKQQLHAADAPALEGALCLWATAQGALTLPSMAEMHPHKTILDLALSLVKHLTRTAPSS